MGFFADRKAQKRKLATREFIFDTIRKLDYVLTREKLSQFIKQQGSHKVLYAYLYGIALYTWSIHVIKMHYEDFATIFNIVDDALNESGINIGHHLNINKDYDKISSGFGDIFVHSIGLGSIRTDADLIASLNKDFQSIGIYYARAYSQNNMDLAKVYLTKLIDTIDNYSSDKSTQIQFQKKDKKVKHNKIPKGRITYAAMKKIKLELEKQKEKNVLKLKRKERALRKKFTQKYSNKSVITRKVNEELKKLEWQYVLELVELEKELKKPAKRKKVQKLDTTQYLQKKEKELRRRFAKKYTNKSVITRKVNEALVKIELELNWENSAREKKLKKKAKRKK